MYSFTFLLFLNISISKYTTYEKQACDIRIRNMILNIYHNIIIWYKTKKLE